MMTAEQLKGSILQLAIQGKLVNQESSEGKAVSLIQEIKKKKQSLIKQGIIKKEKELSPIAENEIPFDIPETWEWVRLGDYAEKVTDYVASGSFASLRENAPSLKTEDYAILVKTADFSNDFTQNLTYTTKHGYEFLNNSNLFGGELVLSNIGSIGKVFIVPKLNRKMTLAPNSVMVRLADDQLRDYLYHFLLSPLGYEELIAITSGTAMKKFNKTDLKTILIPIPPLEEQKRIVAKIEELMPFVEQYAVANTKLNTLNTSFPEMMKKSILQEAVQGKLVPQDPNDEPASLLLKRIAEEKKRLIREGKIKKGKYDYYIEHRKEGPFCVTHKGMSLIDEMIFDLPDNWTFCTLSELVQFIGGYAYKSNLFVKDSPYQVLRLGNVKNDLLKLDVNPVYITENLAKETQEVLVRHNDILLTMTGTRLKRDYFYTVCVDDSDNSLFVNQRVGCLRPYFGEMSKWLSYVLKSNYVLDFIFNYETGTANQGNLGAENIMKIIIPLPPINEQKRIVKMLDELTAINKDLLIGPLCE